MQELENWDFAAAARGSDACVPVLSCDTAGAEHSTVGPLSCHTGATRSDQHPAVSSTQPPSSPSSVGVSVCQTRLGGLSLLCLFCTDPLLWKDYPPEKYSFQYSKAKVIYEAALATLVRHQVGTGFGQQRCCHPRAPDGTKSIFPENTRSGNWPWCPFRAPKINWFVYRNNKQLQKCPKESCPLPLCNPAELWDHTAFPRTGNIKKKS